MRARRLVVVGLLVVLAACGSSAKKGAQPATTTGGSSTPQSTTLGPGVTATEIKIGVSLVDFDCIKQFTDSIRINQDQNYLAYINDINQKGGIANRKIVPVFHSFCPIHPEQALATCTKFTEDDKVFAIIGNVYDPSGNVQTCMAKRHKTPLITFQLSQAIMDKAPPGLILLPGNNPERIEAVVIQLLRQQHTLDGKKIAVLGEAANRKTVTDTLVPAIKTLGIPMGSTAALNIGTTGDTTAAQSQLDSFIERWKTEHVDALFVSGTEVASKQFVEKVRKEMPSVTLITDISDTRGFAREEKNAGRNPNPYEGIITTSGPTPAEYDKSENWKYCADIYKQQTGKDAPNAEAVVPMPGNPGKTLDTYGSINDACQILAMFQQIATKVGQYLNLDNWVNAVDNFGPIVNRGGGQFASLHKGKYDIDDTFRLVAFDSSIGAGGDWKALTPLEDISGS